MNKVKKFILKLFKISDKITFVTKTILYILSVIGIIAILKFCGFFKEQKDDNVPITPGDVTIVTKPSNDSNEILINIQNMIDFLEKRKSESN